LDRNARIIVSVHVKAGVAGLFDSPVFLLFGVLLGNFGLIVSHFHCQTVQAK